MGKATFAASLQIVDHGVVVRTVRMHIVDPLTADSLAEWTTPGYWEVDLFAEEMHENQTLCKPRFCSVIEPGHPSDGLTFNNLEKVTTILGPNKRKILLSGTVTISRSAAITDVSPGNNYTDNNGDEVGFSLGGWETPSPVAVTPGQQVRITVTITMPRHA